MVQFNKQNSPKRLHKMITHGKLKSLTIMSRISTQLLALPHLKFLTCMCVISHFHSTILTRISLCKQVNYDLSLDYEVCEFHRLVFHTTLH